MRLDNSTAAVNYGRFQLDLAVYHVTGSRHDDRLHVWLGSPDTGPLVAVIHDPQAAQQTLSVGDLWRDTDPDWRSTLATRTVNTYTAWQRGHRTGSPTANRTVRECEG